MATKQIILGAGGTIGKLLAKELTQYTDQIYLLSRNPQKVNANDQLVQVNLLDKQQTLEALRGMDIAYLVVGIPYQTKTWQKQWPLIIKNVIDACKENQVRLVFLDNVYMYSSESFANLTEKSPIEPSSKKGMVRTAITEKLFFEIYMKNMEILIARSADFYGPDTTQSMINEMIIKKIYKGKKANWFVDVDKKHAITFTIDAAKALALLGNTASAYNQVWHLPTAPAQTALELIALTARLSGKQPGYQLSSKKMATVLGLFVPIIRESVEMFYQFDRDYVFNSQKFEEAFGWKATPIASGIEKVIHHLNKKS